MPSSAKKLGLLFSKSKAAVLPEVNPSSFILERPKDVAPIRSNRPSNDDSDSEVEPQEFDGEVEDRHFPKRKRAEDDDLDSEAEAEKIIAMKKESRREAKRKFVKPDVEAVPEDEQPCSSSVPKPRFPKDDAEKLERTIFVGNVNVSSSKLAGYRELKATFAKFGPIDSIRFRSLNMEQPISRKKALIQGKFDSVVDSLNAYIVYESAESASKALSANGIVLQGKHLRVDLTTSEGKSDPKRSVFIGNLPLKLKEEDVYTFFEQCGQVSAVRLVRDKATSLGKGFGYVEFKEKASVSIALALNGTKFQERDLRVFPCKAGKKAEAGKEFQGEIASNKNAAKARKDKKKAKKDKKGPLKGFPVKIEKAAIGAPTEKVNTFKKTFDETKKAMLTKSTAKTEVRKDNVESVKSTKSAKSEKTKARNPEEHISKEKLSKSEPKKSKKSATPAESKLEAELRAQLKDIIKTSKNE